RLTAGEVWRLGRDDAEDFQRLALAEPATSCGPETGPGCFLFRPADADFSYVEMIHPTDFSSAQLSGGAGGGELAELRHVVIRRWMEKGVIVRARLRGAFVDRKDDTHRARRIYRDFCAAQIPLTV
ncbi:MAG: hypothetical protein GTO03_11250, partial [Planctomycetales bacterium]|nr:hypothetical protein [Planctomycetales bacterium]